MPLAWDREKQAAHIWTLQVQMDNVISVKKAHACGDVQSNFASPAQAIILGIWFAVALTAMVVHLKTLSRSPLTKAEVNGSKLVNLGCTLSRVMLCRE